MTDSTDPELELSHSFEPGNGWSRRRFVGVSALAGAGLVVPGTRPADASTTGAPAAPRSGRPQPRLRVEHLDEPWGIEAPAPRLSWTAVNRRASVQRAYQVVVGSDESSVRRGRGDVWDSGKVVSAQSVDVGYGGAPLQPARRYHWSVRVWDERGRVSVWSRPAWFETGLLDTGDWASARWIQGTALSVPSLAAAHWLWYPDGAPGEFFPVMTRYFRHSFDVPDAAVGGPAVIAMTADDHFSLYLNGSLVAVRPNETNGWQRAQLYDIGPLLRPGTNTVAVSATNASAEPTPAGLLGVIEISTGSGPISIPTTTGWLTSQTGPDGWQQPAFDDSAWVAPMDQGVFGTGIWGGGVSVQQQSPAPYLRTEFDLAKPVASARLYVSGLGYYVASLNGRRVGDHVLDPAPTSYDRTALYSSYDVTAQLRRGPNALGVVLGRSFYAINSPNIYWNSAPWIADRPALLLKLEVRHRDGTTTTVVSDETWLTRDSPTRSDSVYDGDVFDAREAVPGWDEPGLATAGWDPVGVTTSPKLPDRIRAQAMPPVRVTEELRAEAVTRLASGSYVFAFPQLITGWPRLHVDAPAGTTVHLRYGEIRNADGTVKNAGDPGITPTELQHCSYVCAGDGPQSWEPSFSYGSFRYVQLDGYPGTPPPDAVTARRVHTDVTDAGGFASSDELLDAVHTMTRDTLLNNLTGIPTDTPMYEKRGWLGDAAMFVGASVDQFDTQSFWASFLEVMADGQGANGNYGDLAPANAVGAGGDPTWSSAGLVIPWYLHQEYGDTGVLAGHYDRMRRFVDYLTAVSTGHLVNGTYGDWCAPGHVAPPEGGRLTSTASYYRSADLLARIAAVLGRTDDAATYADLAGTVKNAFNAAFLDAATGTYRTEVEAGYRQASNAYPLYLGLVPDDARDAVVDTLVTQIGAKDDHLDTGIVGTMALFPALTEHGHVDLAYRVATRRTYPGFGYWRSIGATTLLEQWTSTPRSHNHAMFGSVVDWFYKYLAGIRPAAPGYRSILVKPYPPAGLDWVRAHRDTPYGRVAVDWQRSGRSFRLRADIPPNTTAEIHVPVAGATGQVTSSTGKPPVSVDADDARYDVGPGTHQFVVTR